MSPVWSTMDAGPVISLSMFCPHMVLLANTVVQITQLLALHVYKQNRVRCWMVHRKQTKDIYSNPTINSQSFIYGITVKFVYTQDVSLRKY